MARLVSSDHYCTSVCITNFLIGVASEFGVGSTFAFWVKAKRSSAPPEAEGLNRPAVRAASDATGRKIPSMVNAKAGGVDARPIKVLVSCVFPHSTHVFLILSHTLFRLSLGTLDLTDRRS